MTDELLKDLKDTFIRENSFDETKIKNFRLRVILYPAFTSKCRISYMIFFNIITPEFLTY